MLGPGEAMLIYAVLEERTALWVITPQVLPGRKGGGTSYRSPGLLPTSARASQADRFP